MVSQSGLPKRLLFEEKRNTFDEWKDGIMVLEFRELVGRKGINRGGRNRQRSSWGVFLGSFMSVKTCDMAGSRTLNSHWQERKLLPYALEVSGVDLWAGLD